jgi:hypothetical protein
MVSTRFQVRGAEERVCNRSAPAWREVERDRGWEWVNVVASSISGGKWVRREVGQKGKVDKLG